MYNFEERTLKYSVEVRKFARELTKSNTNSEDIKQLVRSSGSVGANYIEANESLSKKDFLFRLRISRKEAKESLYWLKIIQQSNQLAPSLHTKCESLIQETKEIKNILSAIINKSQ